MFTNVSIKILLLMFKVNIIISEDSNGPMCIILELERERRKHSVFETKHEENFKMKGAVNIDPQYPRLKCHGDRML